MANAPHNLADYLAYARGKFNRVVMKLLYGAQVQDLGLRQLFLLPIIRFANGRVTFGRGTVVRGRLTIVFGDTLPGELTLGDSCVVDGDLTLSPRGGSISIGPRCFLGKQSVLQAYRGSFITLGSDVMVAHGVTIVASNHGTDLGQPMNLQPENGRGIVIEGDVWIAAGAVILDGVTLGQGAIVAAGAVVHRNVAPYSIVAGVPARQVGTRKPDDVAGSPK